MLLKFFGKIELPVVELLHKILRITISPLLKPNDENWILCLSIISIWKDRLH